MAYRAQVIPPGFNQATAAMQSVLRMATGTSAIRSSTRSTSSRKRRKKAGTKISRAVRRKSATGSRARRKAGRLVKGSAAAKRYMAKLRKMVSKRR